MKSPVTVKYSDCDWKTTPELQPDQTLMNAAEKAVIDQKPIREVWDFRTNSLTSPGGLTAVFSPGVGASGWLPDVEGGNPAPGGTFQRGRRI